MIKQAPASRLPALAFSAVVTLARLAARLTGRRRSVDIIIYKVDRIGDWLLAEQAIERIAAAARAQGRTCVVWASVETREVRAWRVPSVPVEEIALVTNSVGERLRKLVRMARLLGEYQTETLISLRHAPEPMRRLVTDNIAAKTIVALDEPYIRSAPAALAPSDLPREIGRHARVLALAGFPVAEPRDLLPHFRTVVAHPLSRVIIAPFGSTSERDWPEGSWGRVLQALAPLGAALEVWVGPAQRARAEALARTLAARGLAEPVAVKVDTFAAFAGAVAEAKLVLTIESVAAHLAVASGVPMVCILGGGHFGEMSPWGGSATQRWVNHPLPCYNCDWYCTRPSVECIGLIPEAEIIAAARGVLGR